MAGRGDTFFDWHALKVGGANGTATQRIRDWARLLASVSINAIAPQDVPTSVTESWYGNWTPESTEIPLRC